jgi:nitrate reductase NapE component
MERVNIQTAEEIVTLDLTATRETKHASKVFLCLSFCLFFYLSVACLFPRV